jgi:hypothetical protein
MPYVDAVIKEVMRLYGIVDGIWRQTLEDITIQGHHIPKVSALEACECCSPSVHPALAYRLRGPSTARNLHRFGYGAPDREQPS